MKRSSGTALGSLVATSMAAAALALPSPAQAARIGDLCRTNTHVAVITTGGVYGLPEGAWFRIEGFGENSYYGHGNGYPNGFIMPRSVIDQDTCHQ